jgi:Putative bacterial sensory transduction regulator
VGSFLRCKNCNNGESGTTLYKCSDCGKRFCSDDNCIATGYGFIGSKKICPGCDSKNFSSYGEIEDGDEDDSYESEMDDIESLSSKSRYISTGEITKFFEKYGHQIESRYLENGNLLVSIFSEGSRMFQFVCMTFESDNTMIWGGRFRHYWKNFENRSLEYINERNQKNYWGRLHLDSDNDIVLEMEIVLEGATILTLEEGLRLWIKLLRDEMRNSTDL